ncbi:hypothetical protein CCACVL1_12687 [Corchorus capsularis]|uniref:Uncharacterized protein n=1 Tax=Corchorus capsularis TaxID=210143 RepID=A0A1R3IEC2_COCAP|nr:hypothetical protein CCACVL1_12687 [Corchorus capsularis]
MISQGDGTTEKGPQIGPREFFGPDQPNYSGLLCQPNMARLNKLAARQKSWPPAMVCLESYPPPVKKPQQDSRFLQCLIHYCLLKPMEK